MPSASPHSAQAESRMIEKTTISSPLEIVPTLGAALTDVEFESTAKNGGLVKAPECQQTNDAGLRMVLRLAIDLHFTAGT